MVSVRDLVSNLESKSGSGGGSGLQSSNSSSSYSKSSSLQSCKKSSGDIKSEENLEIQSTIIVDDDYVVSSTTDSYGCDDSFLILNNSSVAIEAQQYTADTVAAENQILNVDNNVQSPPSQSPPPQSPNPPPPPLPPKASPLLQNIEPFNVRKGHLIDVVDVDVDVNVDVDVDHLTNGIKNNRSNISKITQTKNHTFLHYETYLKTTKTKHILPFPKVSFIDEFSFGNFFLLCFGSNAIIVSLANPSIALYSFTIDSIITCTITFGEDCILVVGDSGSSTCVTVYNGGISGIGSNSISNDPTKQSEITNQQQQFKIKPSSGEPLLDAITTTTECANSVIIASNHGRWIEIRRKDESLSLHSRFQWREYSTIPDDVVGMTFSGCSSSLLWTFHRGGAVVCWEWTERIRIIKMLRIINPMDEEISSCSFFSGSCKVYLLVKRSLTAIASATATATTKTATTKNKFSYKLQEFDLKNLAFTSCTVIPLQEKIASLSIEEDNLGLLYEYNGGGSRGGTTPKTTPKTAATTSEFKEYKIVFPAELENKAPKIPLSIRALSWNVDAQPPPTIDSPFWSEWFGFDCGPGGGPGDNIKSTTEKPPKPSLLLIGLQEIVKLNDKKLGAKTLFKDLKHSTYNGGSSGSSSISAPLPTAFGYRWSQRIGDLLMHDWIKVGEYCMVGLWSSIWRLKNDGFVSCSCGCICGGGGGGSSGSDGNGSDKEKRQCNAELNENLQFKLTFKSVKRGFGGLHGNKGAIIGQITKGQNVILFINCHLAAGHMELRKRYDDIRSILEDDGHCSMALLDNVDHCIILGDLNYRAMFAGKDDLRVVERGISGHLTFGNEDCVDWVDISAKFDQLKLLTAPQLQSWNASAITPPWGFPLKAFEEGDIAFPPTYKYQRGSTDLAVADGKRYPSWCDRILYRCCNGFDNYDPVEKFCTTTNATATATKRITNYRSHPSMSISDHKAISGQINIILRK